MKLLEPKINKDGIRRWAFTCSRCSYIPDKQFIVTDIQDECVVSGIWTWPEPDFATTHRMSKRTGRPGLRALHMPDRCNSCKAAYRRSTRMRKRIKRIFEICNELPTNYRVPKLLTFALPSQYFHFESKYTTTRDLEIAKLNALVPRARRILSRHGIIGGCYVVECTEKFIPDLDNFTHPLYKFHAHIHMVCIGKYQKDIKSFCETLLPIGLGRINYEATRSRKKVGNYLSKYLVKDNQRSRSFGIVYRSKLNQDFH